jgi:hypothetical protein
VLAADDIHCQETDTMCDIEHNVSMYLLFDRLVRVPSAGGTLYSISAVLGPIEYTHSDENCWNQRTATSLMHAL